MTAQERKVNTEATLKQLNIPIGKDLQAITEESEVRVRSAADIAKRVLILTYLNIIAQDENFKNDVVAFLKGNDLWGDVSGNEKLLLLKNELSDSDKIFISWQSEATWLLLWALNKVEITTLPTQECDINEILKLLPSDGTAAFINNAVTRPAAKILDMLDMVYRLHWAVSDAEYNEMPIPADMNPGVVHERHYALNWVVYNLEQWDEIAI